MAVIPHDAGSNQPAHQASGTLNTRFTQALDGWLQTAKLTLNTLPNTNQTSTEPPIPTPSPGEIISLPVVFPAHPSRHIRAEIRIQDGCDAHCTFCIIPKIRPTLRSKSIADAVAEARALVALGHVEIVLSGIFLGAFGHPTALRRRQSAPGAPYLAELLDAVAAVPGLERLRISSMEPMDVTDELLDAMVANRGVVVPHLHLPLQSGSNAILRRMNRQYDADDYRAMLDRVESALTEHGLPPAITTDIICGFPGSTEDDFQATVAMAERASYLHIHAFPFSPRQGTAAARWKADMVPMDVRRRRVRDLMELEQRPGDGLADRFRRRLIGRTLRIVVEGPAELAEAGSRRRTTDAPAPPNHPVPPDHPDHPDWIVGRCDHHVRVRVRSNAPRGSILHVRADALDTDAIVATDVAASTITLPQLTG
ncbi:MAG: radical SAM protein [Phycisphaerales bacterium]